MVTCCSQAKLKTPGQLQELLDITRDLLLVSRARTRRAHILHAR